MVVDVVLDPHSVLLLLSINEANKAQEIVLFLEVLMFLLVLNEKLNPSFADFLAIHCFHGLLALLRVSEKDYCVSGSHLVGRVLTDLDRPRHQFEVHKEILNFPHCDRVGQALEFEGNIVISFYSNRVLKKLVQSQNREKKRKHIEDGGKTAYEAFSFRRYTLIAPLLPLLINLILNLY